MSGPRILITDIETSPNLADIWGLFNQNVGLVQLHKVTEVICFAAKWAGEKKKTFASTYHDGKASMIQTAYDLVEEADAVVTWNGQSFDMPHFKREFLLAGYAPPSPIINIDLMRVTKSQFRFTSNKLQHVSTELGYKGKVGHTGHQLWMDCLTGTDEVKAKAWALMRKYNIGDIDVTESVYNSLRPWTPQTMHPNQGLYVDGDVCPRCSSTDLVRRGFYYTTVSKYQRFRCGGCGSWARDRKAVQTVSMRGIA